MYFGCQCACLSRETCSSTHTHEKGCDRDLQLCKRCVEVGIDATCECVLPSIVKTKEDNQHMYMWHVRVWF